MAKMKIRKPRRKPVKIKWQKSGIEPMWGEPGTMTQSWSATRRQKGVEYSIHIHKYMRKGEKPTYDSTFYVSDGGGDVLADPLPSVRAGKSLGEEYLRNVNMFDDFRHD